jgi:hypothetical protein
MTAYQKQTFQINHPDGRHTDFDFKKVKSLFYSVSCSQVSNQSTITVPLCQTSNITVSFSNV